MRGLAGGPARCDVPATQHLFVARTQLPKIGGDLVGLQETERLVKQPTVEPERRSIVANDRDRGGDEVVLCPARRGRRSPGDRANNVA